jgi:hypothetical protein
MSLHPFRRAKFLELTPTAGSIGVIPENDFLPISSVEQMVEGPANSTRALRAIPLLYLQLRESVELNCRDSQTSLKAAVKETS